MATRYQRGNQKTKIEEGQKIQRPQDTKGVDVVYSVLPRFTFSDNPFGILWPLYFLSFLDLRFLITHLVSCGHCIVCPSSIYDFWFPLWYLVAIVLSVLPRFTTSDYPFGILRPLYCLSFLNLRFLNTPLVSCGLYIVGVTRNRKSRKDRKYNGHKIPKG
jgi:hypothetical protein